jgi:pectate lyase
MKKFTIFFMSLIFSVFCLTAEAVVPAFPGAEGAAKYVTGGRGGTVSEVTNLNDSGTGSLREAMGWDTSPRIIVFRVSGTIQLASTLSIRPNITIAGQTAPGDGITLKGKSVAAGNNNIIIRYIRIRPGETSGDIDALNPSGTNVMVDHVSTSWSNDEVMSFPQGDGSDNVTVQWCIISEGLNYSTHTEGAHSKATLLYNAHGHELSFHHNIYAHNVDRNPRVQGYHTAADPCFPLYDPLGVYFDFRNNVVYNWGMSYAGHNPGVNAAASVNFVGNYYIHGPNSPEGSVPWEERSKYAKGYFSDNWVDGNNPADPWSVIRFVGLTDANIAAYKQSSQMPLMSIPPTDGASVAYQKVLAGAGCSVPYRDSVDSRIVNEIDTGTGKLIDCTEANDFYYRQTYATGGTSNTIIFPPSYYARETGPDGYDIEIREGTGAGQIRRITSYQEGSDPAPAIVTVTPNWTTIPDTTSLAAIIIYCDNNGGGWPVLTSTTPPVDTDHDGMPDAWEDARGLNPNDANDGKLDQDSDGYTNVEEYLNYLVDKKAALPADFDEDGDVDENDLDVFTAEWLANDCYEVPRGNMDFDCDADFKDYSKFADNWLEEYGY